MERMMSISEDVLRFMTVRVEELEEVPSAMLQKRDRDEKSERFGERGGFGGDRGGFGGDRGGDRGPRPPRSPRPDAEMEG
jgi:small subunit ribosomal protein S6